MFRTDKLTEAMQAHGIGPKAIADAAHVSRTTLWAIMTGRSMPTFATAKRIADAAGIDVASLWSRP
jgi:transcriptional regulator with XRE-family HTH domain